MKGACGVIDKECEGVGRFGGGRGLEVGDGDDGEVDSRGNSGFRVIIARGVVTGDAGLRIEESGADGGGGQLGDLSGPLHSHYPSLLDDGGARE